MKSLELEKEQALVHFISKEKNKVISLLCALVDSARADDIFQDAIFKVFQLAEGNPSTDSFHRKLEMLTPMLFAIAKNQAISELRHRKVEENYRSDAIHGVTQISQDIESDLISTDESKHLVDAINKLPPVCRQVFVQRKLNGKSHAQIAQMLNVSKKTVESHIAKGLKLCREYLISSRPSQLQSGDREAS